MQELKRKIFILFSSFCLFFFSCAYLHSKYAANETEDFIGQNEQDNMDIDVLDYHFLATNFAFTDRFPVTGYLMDTSVYKIKYDRDISSIYLEMFRQNGPVTSFMRPPLVPLIVGCMYKVFGYKYYFNLRLNILLLSLVVALMPVVGFFNWGRPGYWSGVVGAFLFLKSAHDHWFLNTMGIDVFSAFSFFLVFAIGSYADRKEKLFYYAIWGISIGLSLLIKPILTILPIVYAGFMLIKYRLPAAKKILMMFAGILLAVLPWTVYINCVQRNTMAEREAWCAKVAAGTGKLELTKENVNLLSESKDILNKSETILVRTMWMYHSRTTGFIFITNSFGDGFLNLNNEFCNSAGIHYEWMFVRSSFYRSHCSDSQPAIIKILSFYYHNPSFIYSIPIMRFLYPFIEDYHRYYWLSAALWGLCVLQLQLYAVRNKWVRFVSFLSLLFITALVYVFSFFFSPYAVLLLFLPLFCSGFFFLRSDRGRISPPIYPIMWLCLFISIIFLVPKPIYMLIAMPVSCLCIAYFSLSLLSGFKKLLFGAPENSH